MDTRRIVKRVFRIAVPILAFSAVMDYILWFTREYHVPCWTIATITLATTIILAILEKHI